MMVPVDEPRHDGPSPQIHDFRGRSASTENVGIVAHAKELVCRDRNRFGNPEILIHSHDLAVVKDPIGMLGIRLPAGAEEKQKREKVSVHEDGD